MTLDVSVVCGPGSLDLERRSTLIAVYESAFRAPGYGESADDVRRFAGEQLPKHLLRNGFRLAEARVDGRLVGFAYGYTGERGQWWSDRLVELIPAELADAWVGGHFEFVELAVAPAVQGRGIGTALHDALMADLPHERALLSTYPDDRPAPRLYRRRGWQLLAARYDGESDLYGLRLARSPAQNSDV